MTTDRDAMLSHGQIDLKIASDMAVDAAGGQFKFAKATDRSQSSISDGCSLNTKTFLRLDVIAEIEDRGVGRAGHPHITRALAKRQGFVLVSAGDVGDEDSLPMLLGSVASEAGDVIKLLAERIASGASMTPRAHDDAAREIDELMDAVATLRKAHAQQRPAPPGQP